MDLFLKLAAETEKPRIQGKKKIKTTQAILTLKPILEPDKILKIILCPSLTPLY